MFKKKEINLKKEASLRPDIEVALSETGTHVVPCTNRREGDHGPLRIIKEPSSVAIFSAMAELVDAGLLVPLRIR